MFPNLAEYCNHLRSLFEKSIFPKLVKIMVAWAVTLKIVFRRVGKVSFI